MSILDTTIVNVALETLGRDLHASLADIQWVLTGYMLALGRGDPGHRLGGAPVRRQQRLHRSRSSSSPPARCSAASPTSVDRAHALPRPPGRRRRDAPADRPADDGERRRAAADGPGHEHHRDPGDAGADPRAHARRAHRRQRELALDLLRQRPDRRSIALVAALRDPPARDRTPRRSGSTSSACSCMSTGVPLLTYGLAEIGATGHFPTPRVVVPIIARARPDRASSSSTRCGSRVPLLDLRLYRRATFASASVAMFCLGAAALRRDDPAPALLAGGPRRERPRHRPPDWRRWGSGWSLVLPLVGRLADRYGGGPVALVGVIVTTLATIPFALDRRAHVDRWLLGGRRSFAASASGSPSCRR